MKQQHITRHVIGRDTVSRHSIGRHIIGRAGLAIFASALLATAAFAAGPSGTRVVRDPETGRTMVVNPNVDPFGGFAAPATAGNQEPIILRKPKPHRAAPRKPKVVKAPAAETTTPEAPAAPEASIAAPETPPPAATRPAPPPKKAAPRVETKVAKPAPAAPKHGTGGIPFSLSGDDAAAPPPAAPVSSAPAQGTAAATGAPRNVHINFGAGAVAPTPEAAAALKSIAGNYANEMAGGSNRLLLEAYAGAKGDKSSEARRLSLKRALAVRQLLIDAGVPSDRIDVRALGGADSGNQDRVDISMHG
ncbi:MAG: OmpA family protein [Alphaproteobacteria bacterium]|nr:OmpA family protein [Alphaproteobacteria bacterium]